ncbi:RES family NAD+ phosphorylase [Pseudomonas syringae]|uniref:RES family NAD+ phosphorylase n=1 Tax=Pseudomonas syringae TaxID=317 RepID=UPI003F79A282
MRKDDETAMAAQKICFKCVMDSYLERQIRRNGATDTCSLCASTRKCIPLAQIVTRVEAILRAYICEGEYRRRWSGGVVDCQEGESIDIWVSEIFRCDNVEPIVSAVCRQLNSYSDDINYSKRPFTPDGIGHQWGDFQEGMMHGNRFFNESAKTFLDWLFEGLDKHSASSDEHGVVRELTAENAPSIYRARTCMSQGTVKEIAADPARNLAAPPKEIAGEGRMNPAGVPAFYGAFERKTCVAELRPPVGGTVVSGKFKLNRAVRVLDFERFENADLGPEPSFFDPKYFSKIARREFLRYIHNIITVPVLPGSERQYLTTQVIAGYLANHCKPRIDGVIFKSVQNKSGSNIVLFSHVACPAKSVIWELNGVHGINGAKSSDSPCIQYVEGSLIHHEIQRVAYRHVGISLPEGQEEVALDYEW